MAGTSTMWQIMDRQGELARQAGADLVVNYRDADAADQLRALAPRMEPGSWS